MMMMGCRKTHSHRLLMIKSMMWIYFPTSADYCDCWPAADRISGVCSLSSAHWASAGGHSLLMPCVSQTSFVRGPAGPLGPHRCSWTVSSWELQLLMSRWLPVSRERAVSLHPHGAARLCSGSKVTVKSPTLENNENSILWLSLQQTSYTAAAENISSLDLLHHVWSVNQRRITLIINIIY